MMAQVINTNISSLFAQESLTLSTTSVRQAMERLSSGYQINSAADNPAGLTISQNLVSSISTSQQALNNTQDGVNVLQIAEGGLTTIQNDLQLMNQLTVEAGNDTNSQSQLNAMAQEMRALVDNIDQIANSTDFNKFGLLDGSASVIGSARLQIGPASNQQNDTLDISLALATATSSALGLFTGATIQSANDLWNPGTNTTQLTSSNIARQFLTNIGTVINTVSQRLSLIGAYQNELSSTNNNLGTSIDNLSAANSRIKDTDVAATTADLTQQQVLQQASVLVLSQANQIPQMLLTLLQPHQ